MMLIGLTRSVCYEVGMVEDLNLLGAPAASLGFSVALAPVSRSVSNTTQREIEEQVVCPKNSHTYRMFAGGSMLGMNSSATYPRPTTPIMVPAMIFSTLPDSKMLPMKT